MWLLPWMLVAAKLAKVLNDPGWNLIFAGCFVLLFLKLLRGNFGTKKTVLAVLFGMPLFTYLLFRSKRMHRKGTVAWKGRTYGSTDDKTENAVPDRNHKTLMKPLVSILAILFALTSSHLPLQGQIAEEPRFTNTMIEPGHSLGPLKLGDSLDRAQELFPKKDIDQEWDDACGSTIDWTDSNNPEGHGEVFIRLKKGKIFQIESSTTRFHTADDITTFDPPEKVEKSYKDMRAWVLLTAPSPAMGSRPPVFWIDKKKGIAFELAYDTPHRKRYVYKVIVFEPNKTFCPEQETVNSLKWQAIDAYRVEPPRELSPEP
jgi:hypothetical protein